MDTHPPVAIPIPPPFETSTPFQDWISRVVDGMNRMKTDEAYRKEVVQHLS